MTWSTIAKYIAGAALYASVYVLVFKGKVPATDYLGLVGPGLAALGYHIASTRKPPAA